MPEAEVVLDVRGLTKWFGDVTALDRVDLCVPAGSVHGLLGPNGAGKTTLLAAVFGLVAADEGTLRLFGRTRAEAGAGWLSGVGGFVETPAFYPHLTGRGNLHILARLDGGGASSLVAELLDLVGLANAAGQKVRGYSLGMRQRLGVAAALLRRPRLLILDEPTNGLDPGGVRDLMRALRPLADNGLAVLLSSHDVAHVEDVCDRVSVLRSGEVVFDGPLTGPVSAVSRPGWLLSTADDDAAVAAAAQLPAVTVVPRDGCGVRVLADRQSMDAYVLHLGRNGIAVRALAADRTPLESLFFSLVEDSAGAHIDRQPEAV